MLELFCCFVCWGLLRSFVRSFVRSSSFVCAFVCSFVCSSFSLLARLIFNGRLDGECDGSLRRWLVAGLVSFGAFGSVLGLVSFNRALEFMLIVDESNKQSAKRADVVAYTR